MTSKDAARYYVGQAFWVKCKDGFEGEGFIESISHTDDIFSPNNIDLFGNEFEDGSIIDFKVFIYQKTPTKYYISECRIRRDFYDFFFASFALRALSFFTTLNTSKKSPLIATFSAYLGFFSFGLVDFAI